MPKKKKTTKKAELTIQERVEKYISDDIKLLQKHNLNKRVVVEFPNRAGKKPPMLGRLALKLLKWSRGSVNIQFIDMSK